MVVEDLPTLDFRRRNLVPLLEQAAGRIKQFAEDLDLFIRPRIVNEKTEI
jgi:hypothetical protein